jgi:integrase/recombinase XerD
MIDDQNAPIPATQQHIIEADARLCSHPLCKQIVMLPEDSIILAWLNAKKTQKSGSDKTHLAYHETANNFKYTLAQFGMTWQSDPERVALVAQGWAAQRSPRSHRSGEVSPATYAQRLACISSLYQYARKMRLWRGENPIEMVERPQVQAYAAAEAFEAEDVRDILKQIDTSTTEGKRDAAILQIGFTTGVRVSDIANMRWGHVTVGRGDASKQKVKVHFPHTKGNKAITRELEVGASRTLMSYLHDIYGAELGNLANDAPIWISFSHNTSNGQVISAKALENICKKWTGTGKFHVTRHSFAYNMEQTGATTSEIQDLLGHENIATTGRYLKKFKGHVNKHARKLERMFGMEDQEGQEELPRG